MYTFNPDSDSKDTGMWQHHHRRSYVLAAADITSLATHRESIKKKRVSNAPGKEDVTSYPEKRSDVAEQAQEDDMTSCSSDRCSKEVAKSSVLRKKVIKFPLPSQRLGIIPVTTSPDGHPDAAPVKTSPDGHLVTSLPDRHRNVTPDKVLPDGQQDSAIPVTLHDEHQGATSVTALPDGHQGNAISVTVPDGQQGSAIPVILHNGQQGATPVTSLPDGHQGNATLATLPDGHQGVKPVKGLPDEHQDETPVTELVDSEEKLRDRAGGATLDASTPLQEKRNNRKSLRDDVRGKETHHV